MKVGVFPPFANPFCTPEHVAAVGQAVDERGFSSLWVAEHVVLFDEYASQYPYLESGRFPARPDVGLIEPFAAMAFLAAVTTNVRLGTGVLLVPQRNPVYTAKSVTTIDWLSNGRVDLGIGVGWLAEEFAALGVPFDRRGERCDEYIAVMRSLWTDEVSTFSRGLLRAAPGPSVSEAGAAAASADPRRRREQRGAAPSGSPVRRLVWLQPRPSGRGRAHHEAAFTHRRRRTPAERGDGERVPLHAIRSPRPRSTRTPAAGVDQLVLYAPIRSTDDIERVLDPHAGDHEPSTLNPSDRAASAWRTSNVRNESAVPSLRAAPRWSASSARTPVCSAIVAASSHVDCVEFDDRDVARAQPRTRHEQRSLPPA